jgi:hypothetical protein
LLQLHLQLSYLLLQQSHIIRLLWLLLWRFLQLAEQEACNKR